MPWSGRVDHGEYLVFSSDLEGNQQATTDPCATCFWASAHVPPVSAGRTRRTPFNAFAVATIYLGQGSGSTCSSPWLSTRKMMSDRTRARVSPAALPRHRISGVAPSQLRRRAITSAMSQSSGVLSSHISSSSSPAWDSTTYARRAERQLLHERDTGLDGDGSAGYFVGRDFVEARRTTSRCARRSDILRGDRSNCPEEIEPGNRRASAPTPGARQSGIDQVRRNERFDCTWTGPAGRARGSRN